MTSFKTVWEGLATSEENELKSISDGYLRFLGLAKTESEAVDFFVNELTDRGFFDLESADRLVPGSKEYQKSMTRQI